MKVRIKDIADRAGVSTGTVDRVIHNRGEVSVKTRKKVTGILDEMQYKPDILARTLASRQPLKVAVLIPFHTPENWFWQEPLTGIYDAISELDHFRIEMKEFLYDQFSKQDFIHQAGKIPDYAPDAVIAAPVFYQEMYAFIDQCKKLRIPFISVNDSTGHPDQVAYIGQDARQSGGVAAHLVKMGIPAHSRVFVISIAKEKDNYRHILYREEGFSEYWKKHAASGGVEIIKHAIPDDHPGYIKSALEGLFQKHSSVTGIFVTNSRVYQVAEYLQNTGRGHILLVGYDLIDPNIRYLNSGVIDFLISQKPREQGYKAMMAAFNILIMNKKTLPEKLIPVDIVCKENLCCYQA